MPDLAPSARKLLGLLQFRDSLGPMYLVSGGRGRYALVATQMYSSATPLARLDAFNGPTVLQLVTAGLINWSDKSEPVKFSGRAHLDDNVGYRVQLTDTGRAYPTPTNRKARANA